MQRSACLFTLVALLASSCAENPSVRGAADQQAKGPDTSTPPVDTAVAAQPPQAAKMTWQRVPGTPGVDIRYGSGYLDLATVVTFAQGERLRLRIGGTAKKVVVRLLPVGRSEEHTSE